MNDEGLGDRLLDIFRVRQYFGLITAGRELAALVRADSRFLDSARRALLPLPFDSWKAPAGHVFGGLSRHAGGPSGARIALVASGGSGATAAVIGVMRALQEAGMRPALMSLCSGSAFFGFPLAAGRSPEHVARFMAGLRPTDYLDPDWASLAAVLPRRGRGFGGLVRGDRVEQTFRRLLGDMTLADLEIPAYAPVWSVEENRVEFIGPRTHPHLPVARAIRMCIAIPLFIEPVRMGAGSWCDGGIVDILPVSPVLDLGATYDAAVVVNSFYPHEFEGEDEGGWRGRRWSVLQIASQVKSNQHVQLAREHLARLRAEVPQVVVLEPVPYSLVRGARFYSQFVDPALWPAHMRAGRRAMSAALPRLVAVPETRRGEAGSAQQATPRPPKARPAAKVTR